MWCADLIPTGCQPGSKEAVRVGRSQTKRANVIVFVRLLMAWATKSATTGMGSEQPNMYLRWWWLL